MTKVEIMARLNSSSNQSIYELYFSVTEQYRRDYGDKTILFMQVGGFYEMYGCYTENRFLDKISKIQEICELCGLNKSEKEATITLKENEKKNIYKIHMAGFRTYNLDKYVKQVVDAGYACVVYDQDEQKSGTTRSLQGVYTQGTLMNCSDEEQKTVNNVIMCSWIHKYRNNTIVGCSCVNIMTGQSYIYEYEVLYELSPETFDEFERFISTFSPSEIILIHNLPSLKSQTHLMDLCNIPSQTRTCVVDINSNDNDKMLSRATNSIKQVYQNELFAQFFNDRITPQTTNMFNTYAIATQSFCFLLDYIFQNNKYLLNGIGVPVFENQSDRVVLGNHSLKQLNIIETTSSRQKNHYNYTSSYVEPYSTTVKTHKKRFNSICDLLNYCKTPMGTRLFHYTMTHPHNNVEILTTIYDTTEWCKTSLNSNDYHKIIVSLSNMYDLEAITKRVSMTRIKPNDIPKIYGTLRETQTILLFCNNYTEKQTFITYFKTISGISLEDVSTNCKAEINVFERIFNTTALCPLKTNNEEVSQLIHENDTNIFNMGVYDDHDIKVIENYISVYQLLIVYHYLNDLFKKAELKQSKTKKMKDYQTEPVKLNITDKGSISFELTSTRSKMLETYMKNNTETLVSILSDASHAKVINSGLIPSYVLKNDEFIKRCSDVVKVENQLTIEKASSNSQKTITSSIIKGIIATTQNAKETLNKSIHKHFSQFIEDYKERLSDYISILKFCGHMDMLMCYTTVAKISNYCKPEIMSDEENDVSFCDFTGLRHPLIENLLDNELYVANSISLTSSKESEVETLFNKGQGFLLYGTNTVGKSSFIKSIGIAVIMAQCGFYVAAEKMHFHPYKSIYTRILGNDNLFRGLSTFNVEMIELKNILNGADKYSLVLGDEVCSGTEMGSASSIFMSALEHLYERNCKYIFATHFHNVCECIEMKKMEFMKNIHLSVKYDIEHDTLVYDRLLKTGAGENMYGLEVCKYLHLPPDFIIRAYELRNKYFSEHTSILDMKQSKYNPNKLMGNCEKCGKKGSEVHHLQHQRRSDEQGFIKNEKTSHYFHKNSKGNLMTLCNDCHDEIHKSSSEGHYRKSKNSIVSIN